MHLLCLLGGWSCCPCLPHLVSSHSDSGHDHVEMTEDSLITYIPLLHTITQQWHHCPIISCWSAVLFQSCKPFICSQHCGAGWGGFPVHQAVWEETSTPVWRIQDSWGQWEGREHLAKASKGWDEEGKTKCRCPCPI